MLMHLVSRSSAIDLSAAVQPAGIKAPAATDTKCMELAAATQGRLRLDLPEARNFQLSTQFSQHGQEQVWAFIRRQHANCHFNSSGAITSTTSHMQGSPEPSLLGSQQHGNIHQQSQQQREQTPEQHWGDHDQRALMQSVRRLAEAQLRNLSEQQALITLQLRMIQQIGANSAVSDILGASYTNLLTGAASNLTSQRAALLLRQEQQRKLLLG